MVCKCGIMHEIHANHWKKGWCILHHNIYVMEHYNKWLRFRLKNPLHKWQWLQHCKGHFTHETESQWPLHVKHSHWWKRWSRFKFASHYAWGTDIVSECKMDVKSTWIPTWHPMDHVLWSLGRFSKTTSWRYAQHKWETMALRTLITVDLFYFIVCGDPHE